MKRLLGVFLGILTAIGGFVDIGELVAGSDTGSRFRLSLVWSTVLALVAIMVFAEMAGRVAAISGRPVFDLVRERLGSRMGLANLAASFVITLATVAAEVAGVALSLELATSVNRLLWIPVAGFALWLVIWRVSFKHMENSLGMLGLALIATTVAVVALHPHWGGMIHQATHPSIPRSEGAANYFYFAIAMFGAGVMPYEVFFFSSGAIEERWSKQDLSLARANVFVGFPLGSVLTIGLMAGAALVLAPRHISVDQLFQSGLPTAVALGKVGLAVALLGFVACTFGAAVETTLSCGYMVAQYFGWRWGKSVRPRDDPRFHAVLLVTIVVATVLVMTGIDPVKLTEYVVVLSAAALPLTYLPVLVVANDPQFMGDRANGRLANALGFLMLVVVVAVSLVTIPLMIITKGGG